MFRPTRLVFGVATLALAFSMLGPVGANAIVDDADALDMYTADVSTARTRPRSPPAASTSPTAGSPIRREHRPRAHRR